MAYRFDLPATGFWSYNGTVGNWSPTPLPAEAGHTTWAEWAVEHGLDPDDWELPAGWVKGPT